jgi:hypothetical protein
VFFSPKSKLDRSAQNSSAGGILVKKATIVISLVDESSENSSEEIEKEIFEELSKGLPKIPWFKRVEKVLVS